MPVAQSMVSTSSTHVPSVKRTPDGIRRAIPGRTWTLPHKMRLGRSSFVTAGLASTSWLGCSAYSRWSKRALTCFSTWLLVKRSGRRWTRKFVKRVYRARSSGRPSSHTRRTNHAPFLTLRYTWVAAALCVKSCWTEQNYHFRQTTADFRQRKIWVL